MRVAACGLLLASLPVPAAESDKLERAANGTDSKLVLTRDRIHAKLKPLFQKYYPKVASTNLAFGTHFEFDVKTFEFPVRPGGGKQENPIQIGPKSGGILCIIHEGRGRYRGPFAAPFLMDRKVYKQLLLAPYSPKQDAHLWVSLSYPSDTSEEFLKQFHAAMTEFEKDVD